MVGELNKIFEKNFVVGYAIPSAAFMATSMGMLSAFGGLPRWLEIDPKDPLKDTTFVALVTLTLAIVLMSLNQILFRIMEGYWWFGLDALGFIQRRRRRRLSRRVEGPSPDEQRTGGGGAGSDGDGAYAEEAYEYVQAFPSGEGQVLPTSLGNTVRSFEDYPRVMYNLESITSWSRLNAVVPKEFRETMEDSRSTVDMWMNLWYLSLAALVEYLVLGLTAGWISDWWVPLTTLAGILVVWWLDEWWIYLFVLSLCLIPALLWRTYTFLFAPAGVFAMMWLACSQANAAAADWGEWVKAAFDVYLPELCKKMGYSRPANRREELEFWDYLGDAMTYRNPDSLVPLDKYREKPKSDSASGGTSNSASAPAPSASPGPMASSAAAHGPSSGEDDAVFYFIEIVASPEASGDPAFDTWQPPA